MEQQVKLSPSDYPDNVITVSRAVADMSVTIKNMLDDFGGVPEAPVPIHNANSRILQKVVEYCEHAVAHPNPTGDITPWEREFCTVDQPMLFELILAANYLDIKPLLTLTCKTVANMIKGKTPEEIRAHFNIRNDFTSEEEEQIRRENEWCQER